MFQLILKSLAVRSLALIVSLTWISSAYAQAPAQPEPPGIAGMLVPFLLMFGVIYFLMIRPQQKKMKEHQGLLNSLQNGDDVITTSGLLGKVTGITDKVVTLEVADGVRVKMLKSQIAQVVKGQIKELNT